MKQLSPQETEERQALLGEYRRLCQTADEALKAENIRSRPNWHQFYEAHEQIYSIVKKLRSLNNQ